MTTRIKVIWTVLGAVALLAALLGGVMALIAAGEAAGRETRFVAAVRDIGGTTSRWERENIVRAGELACSFARNPEWKIPESQYNAVLQEWGVTEREAGVFIATAKAQMCWEVYGNR